MKALRTRVALIAAALCLSGGALAAVPAIASANWSSSYDGASYGWTNDHAWMVASYQTIGTVGAGALAGAVCSAAHVPSWLCAAPAAAVFYNDTRGQPWYTNHGIWVAIYPNWIFNWSLAGGRY